MEFYGEDSTIIPWGYFYEILNFDNLKSIYKKDTILTKLSVFLYFYRKDVLSLSQINDVNKQYDFELDLDKGYIGEESISLIQSSSNVRTFKIALTKENREFDLARCLVKSVFFKPSDNSFVGDVLGVDGNIITVKLDEQCMAEDGRIRCEVVVIDLVNETFITFPMFRFKVKGSLFVNSGIESSTEFQTLINAIVKVESINEIADEKFNQIDVQLESAKLVLEELKVTQELGLELLAKIELNFVESQETVGNILSNYDMSESLLDEISNNHSTVKVSTTEVTNNAKTVSDKKDQAISNVNLITTNKTESDTLLASVKANKSTTDTLLGRVQSNDAEATKSLNSIKASEASVNKLQQSVTSANETVQDLTKNVKDMRNEVVDYKNLIVDDYENIHSIFNESDKKLSEIKTNIVNYERQFDSNESNRQLEFKNAELERSKSETTRKQSESIRVAGENERKQSEVDRVNSEDNRKLSEIQRQELMDEFSETMNEALNNVTNLTSQASDMFNTTNEFIQTTEERFLDEHDRIDYMGVHHDTLKSTNDANVEYAVKTAIGEFNYLDYEGQSITTENSLNGHVKSAILKGSTKYRDKTTGEIFDEFQNGNDNLELISVKMPDLRVTGKNLFDGELEFGSFNGTTGENVTSSSCVRSKDFIPVNPNTAYTFSNDLGYGQFVIQYDKNKNVISSNSYTTFTTQSSTRYIKFRTSTASYQNNLSVKYQLEQGTQATPFEPYKSNILTCLEPVELGGIGDVQDTLNVLTGEVVLITDEKRALDINWSPSHLSNCECYRFMTDSIILMNSRLVLSDKIPLTSDDNIAGIRAIGDRIYIQILKSELSGGTTSDFKDWLKTNNFAFRYVLKEKVHKTVDLRSVDQDGNESIYKNGAPVYSYDGTTHYNCGSEEGSLIPTASLTVPTNIQSVIVAQRSTIQTLSIENEELTNELNRVEEEMLQADMEQLSQTWELDFRVCEVEWLLEDAIPEVYSISSLNTQNLTRKGMMRNMAMSRYEQAKTLILAGNYNRGTLEPQLKRYLEKKYLTQEEFDELIALMDARELVSGE